MKNFRLPALCAAGIVLVLALADRSTDAQRIRILEDDDYCCGPRDVKAKPAAPKVTPLDPSPEQAKQISDLIEQLGAPTLAQRDRAMSEIAKFGAYAITLVREGAKHDDDEVVHRCRLLEELLQEGKAELFLAAKRLGMSNQELDEKLASNDVDALLEILRSRAEPGLVPLWARVFRQLAPRSDRYPAAQLCLKREGPEGYGDALVAAAGALAEGPVNGHCKGMMDLVRMIPPGNARHAVVTLAAAARRVDPQMQGQDGDIALAMAQALRGVYKGRDCLAALSPLPNEPWQKDNDFDNLRAAAAFAMAPNVTEGELKQSRILPYGNMSSRTRVAYVELLARSRLSAQLEQALTAALASDGGEAAVCVAARAYAAGAPAQDVIDVFDALPLSAQLAILEGWWFNPRDLKLFQPFFCKLAQGDNFALRVSCARLLAGCRANSSAIALAQSAIKHEDTAPHMLEALSGMADLLPRAAPNEFRQFVQRVNSPNLRVRPFLHEVLILSGDAAGEQALKARWKREITRPETTLAVRVLARDPSTPAGAWSAGAVASAASQRITLDSLLRQYFTLADFVLLRRLLTLNNEDGFKLLEVVAQDVDDPSRLDAIIALVFAGRDKPYVDDWVKRYSGAISDPHASSLGAAIAYSATPQGEEFRQNALKRGFSAPEFGALTGAVLAGRGGRVTLADILPVMFERPENLRGIGYLDFMIEEPLPHAAAKTFLNALIFDNQDSANLWSDAGRTLSLMRSKVDVLALQYGDAAEGKVVPRTPLQLRVTAMLGDPERARAIVSGLTPQKDGRDFEALEFARRWLGLPDAEKSLGAFSLLAQESPVVGALMLEREAMAGDARPLRELLDGMGHDHPSMWRQNSARFLVRSRWGYIEQPEKSGPVDPAFVPWWGRRYFPRHLVTEKFAVPIEGDWRDWWSARRALCKWDAAKKLYVLEELP